MGWGNITGDERILPVGGGNDLKLESGKPKRIRLLLAPGEEPYSYFEHTLEAEKMENGQKVTTFRTVNCPKTKSTPYADCELCNGQQANRRVRHAAWCWDYEEGTAKILKGGDKIWKPIATTKQMGIDILSIDFIITKTGQSRNDTDYTVINGGPSQFVLPEGTQLTDIMTECRPHTKDEVKSIVEGIGLVWDTMIVPPALKYPATLQEALAHTLPNTKYKGQTMKQVWEENKGMIEWLSKSDRVSFEKAAAQVILVALGGIAIEGVPNLLAGAQAVVAQPQPVVQPVVQQVAPQPQPVVQQVAPQVQPMVQPQPVVQQVPVTVQPAVQQVPVTVQTVVEQPQVQPQPVVPPTVIEQPQPVAPPTQGIDRQSAINEINTLMQTQEKFVKGGYQVMIDAMKSCGNGKTNITEFTDAELVALQTFCRS